MESTDHDSDRSLPRPACPLCGRDAKAVFQVVDVDILQCDRCEHRFAAIDTTADHVQKHYGDDYFFAGQAGYSDYIAGEDLLRRQGRWYAKLLAKHLHPIAPPLTATSDSKTTKPSLFAVGAAAGFDVDELQKIGWSVSGIEPNDTMARFARERNGLDIQTGTLEAIRPSQTYDVVTAIQVMAHFVDPLVAAARLSELVRPDGYLLVETWDHKSLVARCFGRYWHEYSPPTVLQWFSKTSLTELMKCHGFKSVHTGRPAKRIGGTHARSLLEYKLSQMPLASVTHTMLKLLPKDLTLIYPGDDLFWMLFRKTG
jgi:2-polyprenyl-3-methyl-5-hydroxy-6-metoxy-1,4-benzoquinol methylase